MLPEPELNEVAWQMRRRIEDESTYLHIPKTISRAIRNAGFFQPVKMPRTHQSEYLVLIDETIANSPQVKLFEYLVEMLRKQNVFVDKFYYRQEPRNCYNALEPAGISLEKLSEKFPRHILLIYGTGSQLIYPHYPIFDPGYQHLVQRWKYKAILTPSPVPDWKSREKNVLAEEMLLVPADVFGQVLLVQHLFSGKPLDSASLGEYGDLFYKVAPIDFEEPDQLLEYCETAEWARQNSNDPADNILFQWVAALSLYPRVRWELIVAIGKSILEKYKRPEELNFTNLLRITRIKWVSEGHFPDYMRLELLKKVLPENEVVARETILSLLNEIPAQEITVDHFVYEEKEIQRVINEFNLFAHDPVKYAAYSTSGEVFEKLWRDKKIQDAPAKVYLKNEDRQWTTLIQAKKGENAGEEKSNHSMEDYLEEGSQDDKGLYGKKLWIITLAALLFLGSLLSLIGLTILNFVNTSRFPALTYSKSITQEVRFSLVDCSESAGLQSATLLIDDEIVSLSSDRSVPGLVNFNDSLKNMVVQVNTRQVLSTTMAIDHDAYTILLNSPLAIQTPGVKLAATLYLPASCAAGLYDYRRNIADADPDITVNDTVITGIFPEGACLNSLSFGLKIGTDLVNRIIQNFKSSGIDLATRSSSPYAVNDGQIAVYYQPALIPAKKEEPIKVSIFLSDESLRNSAAGFRKALQTRGYTVNPLIISEFNTNSQVTYYNKKLASPAASVQQLYRKYYPDLPILVRFMENATVPDKDKTIRVYIRKLETVNQAVQGPQKPNAGPTPKDGMAYSKQGIAYYNEKNYDGAIEELKIAISLNANDAYSLYYLGMCYQYKYQYREAIDAFSRAVSTTNKNFPRSFEALSYLNRGLSKIQLKDQAGACEDFRRADKLGNTAARKELANCKY